MRGAHSAAFAIDLKPLHWCLQVCMLKEALRLACKLALFDSGRPQRSIRGRLWLPSLTLLHACLPVCMLREALKLACNLALFDAGRPRLRVRCGCQQA